jgi:replicative DNA helicase
MPDPASKIAAFDQKAATSTGAPGLLTALPPKINTGGMVGDMLRGMPRSDDAERGVLSCFLQNPTELLNDAVVTLSPEAFYHAGNRLIYEELIWFNNTPEKKVLDIVTLSQHLIDRGLMDKIGGPATLAELLNFVPTPAHYQYYCGILKDKLLLRRIIAACTESIQNTYEYEENVAGLLDRVEQRVLAVREQTGTQDSIKSLGQHVMEAIESIQEMLQNPGMLRGLGTGYPILDKITNGLQKTEMFIIAARPSMGKTSLAMNIVENVAVVQKKAVAFFSLEMSATMLVRRLIVARAGVSMSRLQSGLLSKEEARAVSKACTELQTAQIFIDDTPGLDILELRAKARRLKKQHGIDLIAIDYLQLLTSGSKRAKDNRQIEISEISAGLKGIAKELDLPIIVLAQLNRAVESRKGQRPMLSDLRESGSIEQDADVVGLLTRADYAGSKQEKEDEEEEEARKGEADLIIAKNRNGPTDDVPLRFHGEQMRFVERQVEGPADS